MGWAGSEGAGGWQGAYRFHERLVGDLPCSLTQVDEIWSYVRQRRPASRQPISLRPRRASSALDTVRRGRARAGAA